MSPPIYTPDGSEVSEIVLPDGSTASQVIGPDGNVVFEAGPDIPDSVTSRPNDDGDFTTTSSQGLVVNFKNDFEKFAVRISRRTGSVPRIRLYDYSASQYIYEDDISGKSGGDVVIIEQAVSANIEYGVEIDNFGSSWTIGFKNLGDFLPYTGEESDITTISQNGAKRDPSDTNVRAINDIGNPDGVFD